MELDKICRLCLMIKKDMRSIFAGNEILSMISEFASLKIENNSGWPDKICVQCVHSVSRAHSFKKKIEKSDEQLKNYIKSLTVVIERPEIRVPEIKPIQLQQPEHPIILNMGLNPSPSLINQNQLFQTANGQICQLIQGPNNTFQMVAAQPAQPQLITQPEVSIVSTENFFEEIPVVLQAANGQQTILNLPHHQVQALQQQIVGNHQQQQQQPEIMQEADEVEVQDYEEQEQFTCEEMEEVAEDTNEQFVQVIEQVQEESSENSDTEDKQMLAEFLAQQTNSEPGKYSCNLCNQEFKHQKWLTSHLKTIHQNWIKANCKKQPQCQKCGKSFRGPGMLKMHMKTHEKENKLPSCSVCGREFKSKSILYRHRATHFQNQKQHRCELCNKNFSSNYQLTTHLQRHQKNQQNLEKMDKKSEDDLKAELN